MNDLQKEIVLSLRKYCETSIELESIAMICFLLRKLPQKRGDSSFLMNADLALIRPILSIRPRLRFLKPSFNYQLRIQLNSHFSQISTCMVDV
jgi:hypothetical protein